MARIKVEYLQAYIDHNGMSLFTRMMGWLPKILRLSSPLSGWLFPVLNLLATSPLGRWGMRNLGMHPDRKFPSFKHSNPSRLQIRNSPKLADRKPVTVWVDTWSRFFQPSVAQAAISVLHKLGHDVEVLYETGCCGRPLITGGQLRKARSGADQLCAELIEPINRGRTIVGLEPSCLLTLRDEYQDLASDQEIANRVARHSQTLEEFLMDSDLGQLIPGDFPKRNVWLHNHCHQRALIPGNPTANLLSTLGFNTTIIASGCCGMAGEFGYLAHHYDVSRAVGEDRLFPSIGEMPDDSILVASGFSCREQIDHFTDHKAIHLAELLDQSIGDCAALPSSNGKASV